MRGVGSGHEITTLEYLVVVRYCRLEKLQVTEQWLLQLSLFTTVLSICYCYSKAQLHACIIKLSKTQLGLNREKVICYQLEFGK